MARATTKTEAPTAVPLRRSCGTMGVYQNLLEAYPSYRINQVQLEHSTRSRLRSVAMQRVGPYVINVVVHVLWNQAAENISTAQIKSQIAVLNRDFSALNPDRSKTPVPWAGLVASARVKFQLASKDPKGKATTGITRTKTTKTEFFDDEGAKSVATGGAASWNTYKYLNIWIVPKLLNGVRQSLLGYAQFPGGPKATDGVVILHSGFGTNGTAAAPYNLGRTTTHEVGHYLNLRHIWGDTEDCSGGDMVDDTPNAETPNYNKPTFPHISCTNGPHGDMFMNYMDYVDDVAMFMFTTGQVSRMQATLDGPRASLVT